MPVRRRSTTSTQRRRDRADFLLFSGTLVMRPCSACVVRGCPCVLSPLDDRCEQCVRLLRSCDLASPNAECHRLSKEMERLQDEALRAEAKAARLRRQRRALAKRLHALDAREKVNIEELEINERLANTSASEPLPDPPGPQSPSGFSQVSFGSLGRTSLVPTSSS
jgi:hypothetical protein